MSNYCTNCKWLTKDLIAKCDTCWRAIPVRTLQRLYGNPTKLLQCINENWYEVKVKQQEKKMTTEEMIKVMQAYVDGKQIEVAKRGEGKGYQPLCDAIWDFVNYHYRIKQEPKQIIIKESEFEEIISIAKTLIARLENNKKE